MILFEKQKTIKIILCCIKNYYKQFSYKSWF